MIGIELVENKGNIVWDYNCGGMFRAWVDEDGTHKCLIFREDDYESGSADWNESMRLGTLPASEGSAYTKQCA
jgi:L-asparaginase